MAKALSQSIQDQINRLDIKIKFIFKLGGTDYSSYLLNWSISFDREFGAASASFTLNNDGGLFGEGGANKINIGDVVEFIEQYGGDSNQFKRFYGIVNQRSILKDAQSRTITLQCLDYISTLQFLDIDYVSEATKIEVNEEELTPNYLSSPNDNMAQLFDFANNSIADNPRPVLVIRNKLSLVDDPQFSGFDIYYDVGQVKLGSPLNVRYNYTLIAHTYFHYPVGLYVEDILEDILILSDGYGGFLFGESSAQNVIDNHLTTTFYNEEWSNVDTLTPNFTSSTITIRTNLTQDYDPDTSGGDSTILYVADTSGFPNNGEGNVNGDVFTWAGKTATTLTGIPMTGNYALKSHKSGSYVNYEATYPAGQIWYLTYSNLTTTLANGHFTVPGASIDYIDKRYGRIILNIAISTSATVTCNTNYSFKSLQATGIELNRISFKPREVENRFEAIKKLLTYVAPNYIIRTIGDNKIWASYLSQKIAHNYELSLIAGITYLEDEDLFTRVLFWGKNKNPKNIMFNDGISLETTGQSYTATARQLELTSTAEETGHWVYGSSISGIGKIKLGTITPIIYVNGVPIDDIPHRQILIPVVVETTVRTESTTTSSGK